jgi:voltage-gated potassium channel
MDTDTASGTTPPELPRHSGGGTAGGRAASRLRIRERWERATGWPLIALSIAFLAAYSLLVLVRDPPDAERTVLVIVIVVAWASFIVDIAVRSVLTPRSDQRAYLWENRYDVASALLPLVRPFQLLRYLRSVPGFRGSSGKALRSRVGVNAAGYAAMFIYVIALTAYLVERSAPGATIVSFGDAVWWAFVTVATVGYGDYTPVTPPGRVLAVILMAGGVAIIGTSSAIIVSSVSERIARAKDLHERDR